MPNILITGSKGQLGSEIQYLSSSYGQYAFFFTDREEIDITKPKTIDIFCKKNKIQTIVNCASYTDVNRAEKEIALCNEINNIGVYHLSTLAKNKGINLIHISTDYVFDGVHNLRFKEDDFPNPVNIYGKTKLLGEETMRTVNPDRSMIIRTSWLYSSFGHNFVKTMIDASKKNKKLDVIDDQIGTPTYAFDLGKCILDILPKIKNKDVEIYHYSNEGICSWYDFSIEIFNQEGIHCPLTPIKTNDHPKVAKRPHFSLMDKEKIKHTFDLTIPHWKHSLSVCLKKLKPK